MTQRAAIIDMGTNTFHILIMEWEGNQYKILDKLQVPVKLGKGAFRDREIKDDAYARGISAMIEFKSLLSNYEVKLVEAYGTSALRNASNASAFLKEAETILGYPIRVIDGMMEAELIYSGVKRAVPLGEEPTLIMDIGGGSVEFIIADEKHIFWKKSYEIGVARLIDRFGNENPVSEKTIQALEQYLEQELAVLWVKCAKYGVKTMVGASGSFESIASIELENFRSAKQAAHFLHHILDLNNFGNIYRKIITSDRATIEKLPGMPAFRVEMIAMAVIMIQYVIGRLNLKKVIASDYALKEGVMFRIMGETVPNWVITH